MSQAARRGILHHCRLCTGTLHRALRTCGRLDVSDGGLLAGDCKALALLVGVIGLLIILIGLIDQLHMKVPLAALARQTGLQASQRPP